VKKTHATRLAEVEQRLDALPIAPELVQEALTTFRAEGELPEDSRLARDVVRRCKFGDVDWPSHTTTVAAFRDLVEAEAKPADKVMHALYDEAVYDDGLIREAAREALRLIAKRGMDPSEPVFLGSKVELPDFGSAGLHVLGWREYLATPPYEEQAERHFARAADLRRRRPHGPRWQAQLDAATTAFQRDGERPDDPLLLDAVLVVGEVWALTKNARGEDAAKELALFDTAATGGPGREQAIAELQAMAKAGAFARRHADDEAQEIPR
jgi:hypothetical protein